MQAPLLRVTNLHRSFGAVRAVNGVDIAVEAGELLGIIGPNGSGKTTLFNCVTGRMAPDEGEVVFGGTVISGRPMAFAARKGLLRTFQESRLFGSATTEESVRMAWELGGRYARERTSAWPSVQGLLSMMGLLDIRDIPARLLPFGRQRSLGIAMCLAMRPLLLLLDEPAAGLNAAECAELADNLRAIRHGGVTLGVVDHDMDFLLPLVERIVVLAEGKQVAAGSAAEIRSDPRVMDVYFGHGHQPDKNSSGHE
jgi:branched-chain amino acid transport system ATP-binding protein